MDEKFRVASTLTRRTFIGVIALGGAALAAPAGALVAGRGLLSEPKDAAAQSYPSSMDQPYLDMTGTAHRLLPAGWRAFRGFGGAA